MSSDCTQSLKKRIAQLEARLRAAHRQAKAQRQRIAHKYGDDFLALIDSNSATRVTVIDIVQKNVIHDEAGNTISETDGLLVGKLIEIRFRPLH